MDVRDFVVMWSERVFALPTVGMWDQISLPMWAFVLFGCFHVVLFLLLWVKWSQVRNLRMQLHQSLEDSASISELFTSELAGLQQKLSQTQEDSEGLDEMLGSILKGGLPGHLELKSTDYWCVKTMQVSYTDTDGKQQQFCQSGYDVHCFVPGGARDIEVTFGVVGGSECKKVNRDRANHPYVYDDHGNTRLEKFTYERCPGHVRYEIRGPSLGAYISRVTEVHGTPATPGGKKAKK